MGLLIAVSPVVAQEPAKEVIPDTPAQVLVKQARIKIAEGHPEEASKLADEAFKLEANQPGAIVTKGMLLAADRKFAEAIAEFDKVTALPGREPVTLLAKADAFTQKSRALLKKGDALAAINNAYFALLEKGDYHDAFIARGEAYIARGQYDKAINISNAAIYHHKSSAEAYCLRGQAYQYQGNVDQALADAKKAIELDSKLAVAYQRRASALAAKGDGLGAM